MPVKFNEKLIAYLALFSGLTLSVVAEYYSIVGLTAIFPTAVIPVVIMGIALGLGKIVATVWLKQNWSIAPLAVKSYLMVAILVLMFITSMGIFGFLSKAHLEQTVPTGDVAAKVALIDEQIRVEKENIDEYRKALAQMDAQVDQRLSRSTDDRGAERAVQIRRQQQAERTKIQKDIASSQSNISRLNLERAPLAADLRKIEAEVGPIKYIAQFVYGETDQTLLEKAVTWVIIILIVVFDPMALILLLASQISFQNFREREETDWGEKYFQEVADELNEAFEEQQPAAEEIKDDLFPTYEEITPKEEVKEPVPHHPDTHPYLRKGFVYPEDWKHEPPLVYKPETTSTYQIFPALQEELDKQDSLFVQNEEQKDSNLWSKTANAISQEQYQAEALSRQEVVIQEWIGKIKRGELRMADLPEHLILEVRSRM